MGTYSETDAYTHIWRTLRDVGQDAASQLLTETELLGFLRQAERRYSRDRPVETVTDETADGTVYLALPSEFEADFSRIISVEAPADEDPPALRDPRSWVLYRRPAGQSLRWLEDAPVAGETVRLLFTSAAAYAAVAADTTVPDADHFAVCDLTASIAAVSIAAKYARTHEPVISADVTNYRTKAQEWLAQGKAWAAAYAAHIGGGDSAPAGPASGWANWDGAGSDGHDRLWHRRGLR